MWRNILSREWRIKATENWFYHTLWHAVLFTVEQIYVMAIDFVYLEYKKISSTRSYQSYSQNYIPCSGQGGQKPYPVQRNIVPLIDHPPETPCFVVFAVLWLASIHTSISVVVAWIVLAMDNCLSLLILMVWFPGRAGDSKVIATNHLACNIETILVPTTRRFLWPGDFR